MWGTFLSEPLSIVGLVGRYPANCLMERMPIYQRWIFSKYPHAGPLLHAVLVRLSPGYPPLIGKLHTRYSPVRRSPPGIATCAAPRLACVKPVASVHPEPGSNSSLFKLFSYILAPESVIVVQSHTSLTVSIRKISSPILVLLVELCKSLKEPFCRFRFANVDAKISVFLLNFQIISELFSRKICFIISVSPFSLECGCKSNAIKHNLQTFSALFFKFFLMAQQSLLLMYAHDKGTYIYLYWCWQYLDGHGNRFQVSRFHEPLFLTHAQVHIIQFLMIAPSASGKNIMSWLRKFFEAIHPA